MEPKIATSDQRSTEVTVGQNLVQNAESFLREAVAYVERGDKQGWILAAVNLTAALELAFKAVLQSEHWTLVFEDVSRASAVALRSGRFKSVSLEEAVRRCKDVVGVDLESRDMRYLEHLRDIRNRVLHYEFELNVEQAKSLVAHGLNIFFYLTTRHLRTGKALAAEISARLVEFEGYVGERMRRLDPQLKKSRRPPNGFRECFECGQESLVVREDEIVCLFCGIRAASRDLAECSEGDLGPCPNCDDGRLGLRLFNNDDGVAICVLCGFTSTKGLNRTCSYCGELFWDDDGQSTNICSDCYRAQIEKE